MKRFDYELLQHQQRCGNESVIAVFGHGCCARGTEYTVRCEKCKEEFGVGKNPGRREYFAGIDKEYIQGTILEDVGSTS